MHGCKEKKMIPKCKFIHIFSKMWKFWKKIPNTYAKVYFCDWRGSIPYPPEGAKLAGEQPELSHLHVITSGSKPAPRYHSPFYEPLPTAQAVVSMLVFPALPDSWTTCAFELFPCLDSFFPVTVDAPLVCLWVFRWYFGQCFSSSEWVFVVTLDFSGYLLVSVFLLVLWTV